MSMQNTAARLGTGLLSVALAFLATAPAQAFSLKVPQAVKDTYQNLVTRLAQEGPMPTAPSGEGTLGQFQPNPMQNGPVSGGQTFTQSPSGQFFQDPNQTSANQFGTQPNGQFMPPNQGQPQEFQQFKEGMGPLRNNLNKFDNMVKDSERKGQPVTQQTKDTLQKSRTTVDTVRRAQNPEEVQNINMDELEGDMQSLEQTKRELEEETRRTQDMKRGMLQMEKGLKQFESQIARLEKQKITVPAEVKDTIAKIKAMLAAIKAAKTFEEIETAGIDDLPDLMQSLDEFRHQLEMLSRWPQTQKQISQQIKNLDKQLKQAKTMVDKLAKQKIDLRDEYSAMQAAVAKLKEVAGVATAKVKSGNADDVETAFDLLENEFFGQMDEVMQSMQVIQTMGNMGRFTADFKRNLTQAQQRINQLKRQKVDTTELQTIYNEAKAQGDEVQALLKAKPLDSEAIQEGLQELENIKQRFEETFSEFSGENADLPWEGGKEQFQQVKLSPDVSKLIPSKEESATEQAF